MYLLNEIRALLWPSAKGIYLTPEMIYSPDDIIDDMKNKYKKEHAEIVNGYEIVGNNSIDFIDSDNRSEHIYYDIQSTDGEKFD